MTALTADLAALGSQASDAELEKYQPGAIALLIVVLLGLATVLLIRSMGRQIKRVDFDDRATDDAGRAAGRLDGDAGEAPRG